jgi:hypothetical protein
MFVWRAVARWTPRLLALLVALELGLFSPLSCVIHCIVQQFVAERAATGFFLCGAYGPAPTAALAAPFADPSPPIAHDPSSAPASTFTPRAVYELVALAYPPLIAVSLLIAVLLFRRACRVAGPTLSPPTPPPRLLPA